MSIQNTISFHVKEAFKTLYNLELETVEFQATRKEFEGDITIVTFPMLRVIKMNPAQLGNDLGDYLVDKVDEVKGFNVVKGFLNIEIADAFFLNFFNEIKDDEAYGFVETEPNGKAIMVEYSSPNTNKPLHLGHIRNNLLGYSVAEILKAAGNNVYKTQIINDRGIHICKSMLAWQRFGNGETPESTGLKGDKLVGNYYVRFDQEYKKEIVVLVEEGKSEDDAKKQAPILLEAQEMLRKWESGDEATVTLWKTMNQWVYDGFEITYKNLGVDFDTLYYESDTYLLGKEFVVEGLKTGVFFKKDDGSVWCDLTEDGLDEKIVLRSDGTAVYMTQDIGTAIQRIKDYPDVGGMVYTVGNEQDYHFKILFLILKKLGFDWAKNLFHLSYGMVDLPSGKMKSREGTVVDADDLIVEMATTAKEISQDLGKLEGYDDTEKENIYNTIGLGALKYFILKVDPKKRILFDPKESVDFQGNTGPFIQYTYARIQAILRKADLDGNVTLSAVEMSLHPKEKELIKQLQLFPEVIQNAANNHSPALIANYTYDLVKSFNSFYQNVSILGADNDNEKIFRVQLSQVVSNTIKNALSLLGINVPERM
ncbi:arginine--tRNA ligase [Flavobacteriaceae bacterium PRS1]|nr:arginine--tRNA ligase [Flavobacteriaceae bacterium PRS1]